MLAELNPPTGDTGTITVARETKLVPEDLSNVYQGTAGLSVMTNDERCPEILLQTSPTHNI